MSQALDKPFSHFPLYTAMRASRAEFLSDWQTWLMSEPSASLALIEMMAVQAMVRDLHDLVTGRVDLRSFADAVECEG